MFTLGDLKKKLEELGVNPKKALGQNFLVNERTVETIVQRTLAMKPTQIVEVGPGLGALTTHLLKADPKLIIIELDSVFSEHWRKQNLHVIEGDALKVSWKDLNLPQGTVFVSNLPYQISSTIMIDRTFESPEITGMVLMFQKEVAQRLQGKEKTEDYGFLSVIAQAYWDVQYVLEAGPKDFYPPPQIASRVLSFTRKKTPTPPPQFLKFMKAAFSQRRKLLSKNLSSLYDRGRVEATFVEMGLLVTARAEELSVLQFQDLYQRLEAGVENKQTQ